MLNVSQSLHPSGSQYTNGFFTVFYSFCTLSIDKYNVNKIIHIIITVVLTTVFAISVVDVTLNEIKLIDNQTT